MILNCISLLNRRLSCKVAARLGLGYLTVPRYMNKETILVSSSSCPARASANFIKDPEENSSLNKFSILFHVSVAVLLEKFHEGKYLEIKSAKNFPERERIICITKHIRNLTLLTINKRHQVFDVGKIETVGPTTTYF